MNAAIHKKNLQSPVFSLRLKILRTLWAGAWFFLFRISPVPFFSLRNAILRLFGASLGSGVRIYPSVKIWWPANLKVEDFGTLGPNVNVYNQGNIAVRKAAIVSQGAHLCASSHNYNDPLHPLILSPIEIGANAWVCADAFVGPGVTVSEGSVIGARAVITKNTEAWGVYAGNPAKKVKERARFS